MEELLEIIEKLLPVFTLIVGSYLTYLFGIKGKREDAARKYKEEQYAKLLVTLQGFVGVTTNGKTKKEFFEEQYKGWLYYSDEVVEAINHMVRLVISNKGGDPDPLEGRKAVGNIVVAMRNDLRGKTNLKYDSFVYTDVIED